MGRLNGKVAIVTGGASGMGKATSELFAKEGAKVVITDIQEDVGIEVANNIINDGFEAIFIRHDVSSEKDWEKVIDATLSHYQKVNILVNNAGIVQIKDIEGTTLEDWNKEIAINATGVFLGTKYAIQVMKENGELCSIINRSSIHGLLGASKTFAYSASKGAVTVLTKSAALSCGEKGYKIRVNSVHPGAVHTPMAEGEAKGFNLDLKDFLESAKKNTPIGFVGEPVDIAYTDLFLASDESRFITGSSLVIDGGYTAK